MEEHEFITLLDNAKAQNSDMAVGIIDNAAVFAPEIRSIFGRSIKNTSYDIDILVKRARGGFRNANEGVKTGKNKYENRNVQCYIFDAQLRADKAVVDAHPWGAATKLATEAAEQTEGSFEELGHQFYYGDDATSKGFAGLSKQSDFVRLGGGSTEDEMTSVYAIYNNLRGVHFVFGANGNIDSRDEWRIQQVPDDKGNFYTAYCNGMQFWLGLQTAPNSIGRLANLDSSNPCTDAKIAELLSDFPLSRQPNMLLMNKKARLQLQNSRSATTERKGETDKVFAPTPTESNGIPILTTDSIVSTEGVVS